MNREIDADRKSWTAPARAERREEKRATATALVTQGQDGHKTRDKPKQKKTGQGKANGGVAAKPKGCGICGLLASAKNGHQGEKCPEIKSLTPRERYDKVRESGGCVKCLNEIHRSEDCPRQGRMCQTDGCQGAHHPLVHFTRQ